MKKRAPAEAFQKIQSGDEAEMAEGRQIAMDWLQNQTRLRGAEYVIPEPETGADMIVSWNPPN